MRDGLEWAAERDAEIERERLLATPGLDWCDDCGGPLCDGPHGCRCADYRAVLDEQFDPERLKGG